MSAASEPIGGESLSNTRAEPSPVAAEERSLLDPAVQTILDRALTQRRQDVAAQHTRQQAAERLRRAHRAWLQVAAYLGDALPSGLAPKEHLRSYVEAILALGRVLESDGWRARLDAVTPGPDAKTYAVTLLRQALDGNRAAVETMDEAIPTLGQLGRHADDWLRRELMYEVLGIDKTPKPPLGWEGGDYHKPIETVADFIKWIDQEFLVQEVLFRGRGHEASDGSRVRNAFRLVSQLALDGMPAEPLGPWTLQNELAVLRNLRRLCLPLLGVAVSEGQDTPAARSRLDAAGDEEVRPEENGWAGKAEAETAEEMIQHFLVDNRTASMNEVTIATGLSAWKVRRTRTWKDHEERILDAYLREHPEADSGDVQNAFGLSRSKVVTTRAWKDHLTCREAARSRHRVERGERPLTEAMVDCRADEAAVDPGARIDLREQIFRSVLEHADANSRALLNGLSSGDRDALVEHLLQSVDSTGTEDRESTAALAIVVEVAQSWLEEYEQERRRTQRRRGCGNVR